MKEFCFVVLPKTGAKVKQRKNHTMRQKMRWAGEVVMVAAAVAAVSIAVASVWRQRFSLALVSVTFFLYTEVLIFFWCSCTVSEVGDELMN